MKVDSWNIPPVIIRGQFTLFRTVVESEQVVTYPVFLPTSLFHLYVFAPKEDRLNSAKDNFFGNSKGSIG